jgi:hypothetical protein
MNTFEKGNLSEAILTAKLLEAGYNVLIPVGSGHRYDLVIDTKDGFKKVQVKTGRIYGDNIIFNTSSNNKGYKRRSYHGEVDLMGVYCPELKECFLVPVNCTGKSSMALRITPTKNKQNKGVNYKDKYLINTSQAIGSQVDSKSTG